MPAKYYPKRGDIVWLQFNPQAGSEQSGHRPAVVISPDNYNKKVGLAVFCPITSITKGYPFEVVLPDNLKVKGVVLSDQIKSLDWRARKVKKIGKIPDSALDEILLKLHALLYN